MLQVVHTCVPESIIQLGRSIGIVEHHQDRPDKRSGKENRDILLAITRHNPYPIALLNPHGQQATSHPVRFILQIGVGPARASPGENETLIVAVLQALKGKKFTESNI